MPKRVCGWPSTGSENHVFRAHRIAGQAGKLRSMPREPLHFLAAHHCHSCAGTGFKKKTICHCVLRRVARIAIGQYHKIRIQGPRANHHVFSRDAEYCVDLCLIAKRALEPREFRLFEEHYLAHRPFHELLHLAGGNRGLFFHSAYRTEQKLGAALIASGCFPPSVYFSGLHQEPERMMTQGWYWMAESGASEPETRLDPPGDKPGAKIPHGLSPNGPGGKGGPAREDRPGSALQAA